MMTAESVPGPSRSLRSSVRRRSSGIARTPAARCFCSPDCPVLSVEGLRGRLCPSRSSCSARGPSCRSLRSPQERLVAQLLRGPEISSPDNAHRLSPYRTRPEALVHRLRRHPHDQPDRSPRQARRSAPLYSCSNPRFGPANVVECSPKRVLGIAACRLIHATIMHGGRIAPGRAGLAPRVAPALTSRSPSEGTSLKLTIDTKRDRSTPFDSSPGCSIHSPTRATWLLRSDPLPGAAPHHQPKVDALSTLG